jgi:ABC-type glycerol-3-phosphate transport system substrate-binding protein
MREMVLKRVIVGLLGLAALVLAAGCGVSATAAGQAATTSGGTPGTVTVDILYLNHPPLRPVLANVDQLLAKYGDKVKVTRYDFDTQEGAAFAKAKNITGHEPLAIFINGSTDAKVDGRQVKFLSFPQGQGTGMVPDGGWSMQDLDAALAQATGAKQ